MSASDRPTWSILISLSLIHFHFRSAVGSFQHLKSLNHAELMEQQALLIGEPVNHPSFAFAMQYGLLRGMCRNGSRCSFIF